MLLDSKQRTCTIGQAKKRMYDPSPQGPESRPAWCDHFLWFAHDGGVKVATTRNMSMSSVSRNFVQKLEANNLIPCVSQHWGCWKGQCASGNWQFRTKSRQVFLTLPWPNHDTLQNQTKIMWNASPSRENVEGMLGFSICPKISEACFSQLSWEMATRHSEGPRTGWIPPAHIYVQELAIDKHGGQKQQQCSHMVFIVSHLQMFAAFMCIHIPASAFFPRHAHPRTKQHWENSLEHDEQLAARTFYYLNRRAKLVRGCFVPKGDVPVPQDFFHLKHAQALLWATGSSLARWELLILRTGSRKLILVSDCVQ